MAIEEGRTWSRRTVLQQAAGIAAVAGVAAACGEPQRPRRAGTGDPHSAHNGVKETIPATKVPIGSGVIVGPYVVTQPTKGTFKAYSTVCPHQGCSITFVKQQSMVCPCHGSEFAVANGAPTLGPASSALESVPVTQSGGVLTIG